MTDFGEECIAVDGGEQFPQESDVRGVTGLLEDDVPFDGKSEQREVTDGIEYLVAHELVAVPKSGVVEYAVIANYHGVVEGPSPGQTVGPERLDVPEEPEGPGRGNVTDKGLLIKVYGELLLTEQLMVKVDVVGDAPSLKGDADDPCVGVGVLDGLGDSHDRHFLALFRNAGIQNHVDEV